MPYDEDMKENFLDFKRNPMTIYLIIVAILVILYLALNK
jgi:fumarate reductase subunit C